MLVYEGTKKDFLLNVEEDTIASQIEETIYNKMKRRTAKNEFRSWENSMQYMYKVLNDTEIPNDAGVAIEYNIPQTSKRVDFLISGYNDHQKGNVVIVELKQWDSIEEVDGQDGLVETYTGNAIRRVVHPSYQAWSYAKLIEDYNENVQDKHIDLSPCAYLHNYRRIESDPIDASRYKVYFDDAPVFSKGEVNKLREFIKKNVKLGDNKELLYCIDNGKIKPSKSLQSTIASMLKGNKEFLMLDDQKVVYEEILYASNLSIIDNKKRVIIVQGGPGTGKTVVAINLLAELTNIDHFCQYVSKNSAPRNVYQAKLKGQMKKSSVDNMFKGTGNYTEAPSNSIDTILVDEAHRANAKSGMFQNIGENQIKEIINAAKCSVFFIDENQRVTMNDIGSICEIERWASEYDAEIIHHELTSQFRCNGSDGYLAWLDHILEIRETANYDLTNIDYDIQIIDSPTRMAELIREKNALTNKSRILAGYCWEWIKGGKSNTNIYDIVIGDFAMSWNLDSSTTFAIDESSINEVGCIHTSQGLEFDYVGVIIGDDLRYEDNRIVTDYTKRAKGDKSIKGLKKLVKENPGLAKIRADEIIKNTYRTLMTRGMKGCYIYCTDHNLSEYLKMKIEK